MTMQAVRDTKRSDHNQKKVSSKRSMAANNLGNKTSARESLNVDKKNYSEHGQSRHGSKVDSRVTYLSSRKQKEIEIDVEIKKEELKQEVLKRQQEILDLQLAMRLAQIETELSNTDQDGTGSNRYKETVMSDCPEF
ncbi:hypothetical protein JTB14_028401 [Gonioctena quinquepunctata]|nr:hypothetical protein JTB14_028401 [Gonioctena quinquepunctata]